jgi:flagellar hook protein FlgE
MASLGGVFDNGVMGLMAQSQAMGSISDNIANIQTTAYKKADTQFGTLLGENTSLVGNTGTTSPSRPTSQNGVASFTHQLVSLEGSIHATQNPTDLAITGPGMFIFADITAAAGSTTFPGNNPTESFVYGRAGDLQQLVPTSVTGQIQSSNGTNITGTAAFLANKNGQFLMAMPVTQTLPGQPARPNVPPTTTTGLVPVQVTDQTPFPGRATSLASLSAVIPAAGATSSSAPIYYYDSNGIKQPLTITFSNPVAVANGGATWTVSVTDANNQPVTSVAPTQMSFDNTGKSTTPSLSITALSTQAPPTTTAAGTPAPAATLPSTTFTLQTDTLQMLGTATAPNGLATNTNLTQDGLSSGAFQGVIIQQDGLIVGQYDGGGTQALYRIPLALFASPDNMQALAGNVYAPTQSSGGPAFALPGQGVANLQVGALEESNVDLASEFSTMILTQQAYGASSQVLKIANEMTQTIAGLQT